jgi:hypothetical protein
MYGFGKSFAAVSVISCSSHTWTGDAVEAANAATGAVERRRQRVDRTRYLIVIVSSCQVHSAL